MPYVSHAEGRRHLGSGIRFPSGSGGGEFFLKDDFGGFLGCVVEGFVGGVTVCPCGAELDKGFAFVERHTGEFAEEFDGVDFVEASGAEVCDTITWGWRSG